MNAEFNSLRPLLESTDKTIQVDGTLRILLRHFVTTVRKWFFRNQCGEILMKSSSKQGSKLF
ncbi:hypothetical protein DP187_21375 [Enterobacter cloacae]|nr:hypothetical protein DP187_21375 [Enterobacter cloacae]